MFTVTGRVVVAETGDGVENLIVTVDDRREDPPSGISKRGSKPVVRRTTERLGAATTGADGGFEVTYTATTDGTATTAALTVSVYAPATESDPDGAKLFASPSQTVRSGGAITLLVKLSHDSLSAAGLTGPLHLPTADAGVVDLAAQATRSTQLRTGLVSAARARVEQAREEAAAASAFEASVLAEVSRAPVAASPGSAGDRSRFVPAGGDLQAAVAASIQDGLSRRFGGRSHRTRYHLTAEVRQAVEAALGDNGTISREALRRALTGSDEPPPTALVRHSEQVAACLRRVRGEAAVDTLLDGAPDGAPGEEPGGAEPGTGVEPATVDDVPIYVARLMAGAGVPGQSAVTGRPDQAVVAADVAGLEVPPGPADKPAIFDFHRLQIAFDDVWQEVMSSDLRAVVAELYAEVRDLGGDPAGDAAGSGSALERLRLEATLVERTRATGDNPVALYREVRDHRGDPGGSTPPPGPSTSGSGTRVDANRRDTTSDLLRRLDEILREPYSFTIFGADERDHAVNFGVVATYRQTWDPTTYQAGEPARTLTLAPQETREFRQRHVVKRKRSEREVTKSSQLRREELSETARAESEIVRKAAVKTNFSLSTSGTYDFKLAGGTTETRAGRDAAEDSAATKRDFHEAVLKAAQEFKNERTIEVDTEASDELETTTTGRITNPNDELAVTFLFYELQRRFRVHETIHRVRPVVLVAQPVPEPGQITIAWLLSHDWILKRTLLDDSFRPALDYLSTRYEGDRLALAHLAEQLAVHRDLVTTLRDEVTVLKSARASAYGSLQQAIEERADQVRGEATDGFWSDVGDFFGGDGQAPEAARILEDAARDAADRATTEAKQSTMRLEREVSALQAASERYQAVLAEHSNRSVQIERLRVHVKQNILFYMQGIWLHEPPDQRYFRLHRQAVPTFEDAGTSYRLARVTDQQVVLDTDRGPTAATAADFELDPQLTVQWDDDTSEHLAEVADLDDLLGFKGNYMIFPLRESNALTDVMLDPYVDAGFDDVMRLVDPDEPGTMSREDFTKFVACLHETLPPAEFDELRDALRSQYRRLLQAATRPGEEVIVPTGSLFIEALPAAHPLLEDYKLAHRIADVAKARAEVRHAELENARLAARLLASAESAGLLADPDVDKKVVVSGVSGVDLTTDSAVTDDD